MTVAVLHACPLHLTFDPHEGLTDRRPTIDSPVPEPRQATAAAVAAADDLAGPPPAGRAEVLERLADALDEHAGELVPLADHETLLGPTRLAGEVTRTSNQLRLFAEVLREGSYLEVAIDHADQTRHPPVPDLRRQLVPLGPVAVFGSSNFPFAFSVLGGDTASALAAGCPVIAKAHPAHPQLSRRVAQIARENLESASMPADALTLVEGFEAGREIVTDPAIRAVAFTGSPAGGRALFDMAMQRPDPIPFYGELGSLNPVVITPEAAHRRTTELAEGLVESFTLGTGQFCTKPGLVLVPADSDLVPELRALAGGWEPKPMLTTGIATAFKERGDALATTDGVVEVLASTVEGHSNVTPRVLVAAVDQLDSAPKTLLEECFGPAVLLVRYRSQDELRRAVSLLPGSLTATVHAEDDELAELDDIVNGLRSRAGRLIFGGWPTGVAVSWAMQHGGPWPSTTAPLHTSVGATAIRRFLRPVTYQDAPDAVLPPALREHNPLDLPRRVDGRYELVSNSAS